jgi:hypothetical protein
MRRRGGFRPRALRVWSPVLWLLSYTSLAMTLDRERAGDNRVSPPGPPAGRRALRKPYAGTCTDDTRLATSRSFSRRAARERNRRIWLTPSAWSKNTEEKAIR